MALLELVRHEPDWTSALEIAFTLPPEVSQDRREGAEDDPPDGERARRISDELLWLRHAIEEPEANGLRLLPESAAVGLWDADDACVKRLCRLRDRQVLDAAGFLVHVSEESSELLDEEA